MPLFETKKITLPGDGWAEVRELSIGELKEADAKGTEAAVALMKALPEKIVEAQMERQRDFAVERVIRYEGYDPETLIRYGLTGWSFEEPCDEEHVQRLGARQGEIVARAIFELSVIPSGEVGGSGSRSHGDVSQNNLPEPTSSILPEGASELVTTPEPPAGS